MIDPSTMDPFTTVWKASHRRRSSKQTGKPDRFHLNPNCPLASGKILKGRLGACLTHGWQLCLYESRPETWNKPINGLTPTEEGRRRAMEALRRGSPLGVASPIKRTVHRRYPKRGEWYLCLRDNDGPWQAGWDHSKEAGGCEAHEHEIVPAPIAIEAGVKP